MTAKTWAIAVVRPEAVRPWDDKYIMAVGIASVIRDCYSVLQQSRAYIDMLSSAMNNDNVPT